MSYPPEIIDTPILRGVNYPIDKGYENNVGSHLLAPNQVAKLLNVRPTLEGFRQKRLGAAIRNGTGGPAWDGDPNGLAYIETRSYGAFSSSTASDARMLVGAWGGRLYKTFDQGINWQAFATSVTLFNSLYQFAAVRDTSYTGFVWNSAFVGAGGMVDLLACCPYVADTSSTSLYGPLILTSFDSNGHFVTGYTNARAMTAFQGRLWVAQDRKLLWTRLNWAHMEGGQFEDNTADDGPITALMPMREAVPRLAVFRLNSIYLLDIYWGGNEGYYPNSAFNLDFTKASYRPIVGDVGCMGARAVTWVPGFESGDFLFMSREGIRSLRRTITDSQSGVNLPLSWRIQPDIDRINWARAETICATYMDGVAYFSVPMDGSLDPNQVIAYDINRDAFYTIDWRVAAWARMTNKSNRKIFFQGSTLTFDPSTFFGHYVYEAFSGNSDPGFTNNPAIVYEEYSRGFSFPSQQDPTGTLMKKDWLTLELNIQGDANTAATLSLYYNVDHQNSGASPAWVQFLTLPIPPGNTAVRQRFSLHQIPPGYNLDLRLFERGSARPIIFDFVVEAAPLSANPLNG